MLQLLNYHDLIIAGIGVALTLVVTAAHARGKKLPFLEKLLDLVQGKPQPVPVPVDPAKEPTLADYIKLVLEELRKRLPIAEDLVPEAPRAEVVVRDDGQKELVVKLPANLK